MEIQLVTIATKIVGYAVAPIGEWLCYSFRYNDNIENMKNEGEQLQSVKNRVQHSVEAAIRNVEEIEDDVNSWLTKADATTEKLKKVIEGNEEAQMRCLYGACMNFKLRHQLSRKAKKIEQEIRELLESGRLFGKDVSYNPATKWMMTTTDPDYVILESRMSATKGLMDALANTTINIIGVWGMGGVGKTTLVREVARQAKEGNFFDEVAITDVTQEPDLKKIQQEIAEMLDLRLVEESLYVRASRLRQRLKPDMIKKKTLIILDDIWDTLDLKHVGIPSEGCTLILISRNRDVLVSGMGTEKDFGLGVLNEEEAWSLFEKMGAGGDSLTNPDIRSTATEVAKECAGLPIALVTVSRALKGKSLFEWKDALLQLRRPVPGHLTQMLVTVYKPIKLSYEHLGRAEEKSVFLLCAHMGYITCYGDLLKYCYGLGLFRGIGTLDDARNRLHTILRTLKVCCLLQDIPYDSERFRMHDIVLDVARYIASELDHNMLVMGDDGGLHAWPDVDALQRCKALSVLGGDIRELPEGMQCPALKFFYINGEHLGALQIPGSFFEELPWEISLLTHLRMLDLSGCSKLEVIPRNVLSSLVKLEELIMGNSFVQWEAEGPNNNGRQNASLAELKHLSRLKTLEIHIPDASVLPRDLKFENLERYEIVVGDVWDWSDKRETSRTLKLKLKTSIQAEEEVQKVLKRSERLFIDELKGIKIFVHELDIDDNLKHLKHLYIQNCDEIEHIVSSSMSALAFPILETILLKNMISLEQICYGQLPTASFGKLRVVEVERCQKLEFVFPSSVARGLSLLEVLEIKDCSIMRAIVVKEEGEIEDGDRILFPRLLKLVLHSLPKLLSFLSKGSLFMPVLMVLRTGRLFPELRVLELSSIHLEEMARFSGRLTNIQPITSRFQNLSSLIVKSCSNMRYLLSFSTARAMVQLQMLQVVKCKDMEEILTQDLGEEEIANPEELFPRLQNLLLQHLPILERFCIGRNIQFPSMKLLRIEHCPKLMTFIFNPVSSSMTARKEVDEMTTEEKPHNVMQPLFNEEKDVHIKEQEMSPLGFNCNM
ncbi:hypothetical protein CJ030_MR8G007350 [Morella rubra]|uniref:AAA+ ATPase domain-containing protein n=1 Tax=Morella rubra TaxID=262757 RepID=A0A6A1UQD0_9ROSI|nr:hypothetical protein CJ030_MR8G007350 [Morella rubra]